LAAPLPSAPQEELRIERTAGHEGPSPSRTEAAVLENPSTRVNSSPERLAEEVAILRRIDEALRKGDGRGALEAIEEHRRSFGSGALVEEREASRVLALCELGRRDEAVRYASEFRRRFPRSPSAVRVDGSCVGN
jgi:RNA polymerase sigma-70 factor (ECF subfamily)